MKKVKKNVQVSSGLFIPKKVLQEAQIETDEIEMELQEKEIRIYPNEEVKRKIFTRESPLWECVGFAKAKGDHGRDHDTYLYNEKK